MKTVLQLLQAKGRDVYAIGQEARVYDALKLMAEKDVGALVVLDGQRVVGIISERDYARKVILRGRSSADTPVWQIMSSPVTTVSPDEDTERCMQLMTERRIRHLPVIEHGKMIGIVSIGDLVKAVIDEQRQTIEQLERYIAG